MDTLSRDVELTFKEGQPSSTVPHFMIIPGCRNRVLVPGRPLMCLRCPRVGHIHRHCRTPRCTERHRYGHSADTFVIAYAHKLRPTRVPKDDVAAEHLMDVSELVDSLVKFRWRSYFCLLNYHETMVQIVYLFIGHQRDVYGGVDTALLW